MLLCTLQVSDVDIFGQLTNINFSGAEKVSFSFSFFPIAYHFPNTYCPRCLKCLNDIVNNSCVVVGVVASFRQVQARSWTVTDFVHDCPRQWRETFGILVSTAGRWLATQSEVSCG